VEAKELKLIFNMMFNTLRTGVRYIHTSISA